jgi:hypothetical protein
MASGAARNWEPKSLGEECQPMNTFLGLFSEQTKLQFFKK